jgi:hypothetical protein
MDYCQLKFPLDTLLVLGLLSNHPALTNEGRLISVFRRWAGSGGREARWRCDANALPAVQAASSRRASPRVTGPADGGDRAIIRFAPAPSGP